MLSIHMCVSWATWFWTCGIVEGTLSAAESAYLGKWAHTNVCVVVLQVDTSLYIVCVCVSWYQDKPC